MRRENYLLPLFIERPDRVGRDRLEILTALIGGPSFESASGAPAVAPGPAQRGGRRVKL